MQRISALLFPDYTALSRPPGGKEQGWVGCKSVGVGGGRGASEVPRRISAKLPVTKETMTIAHLRRL